MQYEWGTIKFKTDANVAGKVFEDLSNTVGLTNKNLVDASRDENSPLHNEFEWNDTIAGEKWRREQARSMIANLKIVVNEVENKEPIRAFVKLVKGSDKLETPYEPMQVVIKTKDMRETLIERALEELEAFETKYKHLTELREVWESIEKVKVRRKKE